MVDPLRRPGRHGRGRWGRLASPGLGVRRGRMTTGGNRAAGARARVCITCAQPARGCAAAAFPTCGRGRRSTPGHGLTWPPSPRRSGGLRRAWLSTAGGSDPDRDRGPAPHSQWPRARRRGLLQSGQVTVAPCSPLPSCPALRPMVPGIDPHLRRRSLTGAPVALRGSEFARHGHGPRPASTRSREP